jgi:hypothetical protein
MTSDALSNESNRESLGEAGSTANRNVSIDPAVFAWVRCLTQRVELGCPRPAHFRVTGSAAGPLHEDSRRCRRVFHTQCGKRATFPGPAASERRVRGRSWRSLVVDERRPTVCPRSRGLDL